MLREELALETIDDWRSIIDTYEDERDTDDAEWEAGWALEYLWWPGAWDARAEDSQSDDDNSVAGCEEPGYNSSENEETEK